MLVGEPIGEARRMALMNRLIETLGEEEARTLMESLPPVMWHDIATKDDLSAGFERQRGYVDLQLAKVIRTMVFTVAGFSLAIMGTVLGTVLTVGLG